jgi:hypothetical protein
VTPSVRMLGWWSSPTSDSRRPLRGFRRRRAFSRHHWLPTSLSVSATAAEM